MGDFGPSWSSAIGGGLGSRGELEGDAAMVGRVGGENARERVWWTNARWLSGVRCQADGTSNLNVEFSHIVSYASPE
jgi:hypothetical protein